jgi:hypothetical protein
MSPKTPSPRLRKVRQRAIDGRDSTRNRPDKTLECAKSAECAPHKHHYDHCVERVTKQQEENGKADEDCVEECEYTVVPSERLRQSC